MSLRSNLPINTPNRATATRSAATTRSATHTLNVSNVQRSNQQLATQSSATQLNGYGYVPAPIIPPALEASTPRISTRADRFTTQTTGAAYSPTTQPSTSTTSTPTLPLPLIAPPISLHAETSYTPDIYFQTATTSPNPSSSSSSSLPIGLTPASSTESFYLQSWTPPEQPADFYIDNQTELSTFVYDTALHSLIDPSVKHELVLARSFDMQDKYQVPPTVANLIAVAGVQGEYDRILPYMRDKYLRAYLNAESSSTDQVEPFAHLARSQSAESCSTKWTAQSYSGSRSVALNIPNAPQSTRNQNVQPRKDLGEQASVNLQAPNVEINPPQQSVPVNRLNQKLSSNMQPLYWQKMIQLGIKIPELEFDRELGVYRIPQSLNGGPTQEQLTALHDYISHLSDAAVLSEAKKFGLHPNPEVATTNTAAYARELKLANSGRALYWWEEARRLLAPYGQDIGLVKKDHRWEASHPFLIPLINNLVNAQSSGIRQAIVHRWMNDPQTQAILSTANLAIPVTPMTQQPDYWHYAQLKAPSLPTLVKDQNGVIIPSPARFDTRTPALHNQIHRLANAGGAYQGSIDTTLRRYGALQNPEAVDAELARAQAAQYAELHWYQEATQILSNPPKLVQMEEGSWGLDQNINHFDEWHGLMLQLVSATTSGQRREIIHTAVRNNPAVFKDRSFLADSFRRLTLLDGVRETRTRAPMPWTQLMQAQSFRDDDPLFPGQTLRETQLYKEVRPEQWELDSTPFIQEKYGRILARLNQHAVESHDDFKERKIILKLFGMHANAEVPAKERGITRAAIDDTNLARMGANNHWWQEVIDATQEIYELPATAANAGGWPERTTSTGKIFIQYPGLYLEKAEKADTDAIDDYSEFLIPEELKELARKLCDANSRADRRALVAANIHLIKNAVANDKASIYGSRAETAYKKHKISEYCDYLTQENRHIEGILDRMYHEENCLSRLSALLESDPLVDTNDLFRAAMQAYDTEHPVPPRPRKLVRNAQPMQDGLRGNITPVFL